MCQLSAQVLKLNWVPTQFWFNNKSNKNATIICPTAGLDLSQTLGWLSTFSYFKRRQIDVHPGVGSKVNSAHGNIIVTKVNFHPWVVGTQNSALRAGLSEENFSLKRCLRHLQCFALEHNVTRAKHLRSVLTGFEHWVLDRLLWLKSVGFCNLLGTPYALV